MSGGDHLFLDTHADQAAEYIATYLEQFQRFSNRSVTNVRSATIIKDVAQRTRNTTAITTYIKSLRARFK